MRLALSPWRQDRISGTAPPETGAGFGALPPWRPAGPFSAHARQPLLQNSASAGAGTGRPLEMGEV
ncbi:hypothetical protein RBY4I_3178 [Rhodobacterales bacterium Y4I]|nr:hypothetical protein RBY4I_3178 [Rhodobacterales bacterium Y4I]